MKPESDPQDPVHHDDLKAHEDPDDLRATLERTYDEITAYYNELNGESPRAAAILAMASVENELERLIRTKFPRSLDDKQWKKKICGPGHTPFGTFAAKADVAQAFGFYGPQTRKLLELVSRVRNKFAHTPKSRSFSDDDILKICKEIQPKEVGKIPSSDNPNERDVRHHYIRAVSDLHNALERLATHVPQVHGPLAPLP